MKSNENKFWEKVNKQGPNDCWNWTGAKHPTGYGKLWMRLPDLVCKPAHHASLIIHGTIVPKGLIVMHKCDNPSCVNPTHLVIGTQQDNIADKLAKSR